MFAVEILPCHLFSISHCRLQAPACGLQRTADVGAQVRALGEYSAFARKCSQSRSFRATCSRFPIADCKHPLAGSKEPQMLAHKFAHLGNIARLPVNVRSRDPSVPLVLDFPLPIASTRLRAPKNRRCWRTSSRTWGI